MIRINLNFFGQELVNKIESETLPQAQSALQSLKTKSCQGAEWTGWYQWPKEHGFDLVGQVEQFAAQKKGSYDCVVVIGIGGSYLGARAVVEALSKKDGPHLPVYFLGQHLSSESTRDVLAALTDKRPLINVISKSGTTTEPAVAFRVLRDWMIQKHGEDELWQRVVCTTDPEKGALHALATSKRLPLFEVPPDVGGRYSVLTAVGLVPLALAGYDIEALMRGAGRFFDDIDGESGRAVCRYASARQAAYKYEQKTVEMYAYAEPKLAMVVEWLKQLFGESEGKQGEGILPVGLAYTTDLHSLGQLAQDGQRNLFETFLSFASADDEIKVPPGESTDGLDYLVGKTIDDINRQAVLATKLAHFDGGVPCLDLEFDCLREDTLGELFAFFETACALSAAIQGVNPFDQPGVEAYKKNLFALMGKPGFEKLSEELRKRLT